MSAQQVNSRSSKREVEQIDVTKCRRFIVRFHFRNELTTAWWCGGAWPLTAKRREKRFRFGIQSMQRKNYSPTPITETLSSSAEINYDTVEMTRFDTSKRDFTFVRR